MCTHVLEKLEYSMVQSLLRFTIMHLILHDCFVEFVKIFVLKINVGLHAMKHAFI